jgi:hydrogenase maturation protease
MMSRFLCIGCGNTLRSDDGAGVRAVESLEDELSAVKCKTVQQLTVDMAEEISQAEIAVIIDAAVDVEEVTTRLVEVPEGPHQPHSHFASPEALLALSRELYGRSPRVYAVRIPVRTFEFGESLSPETARAVAECCTIVRQIFAGELRAAPGITPL